MKSFTKVLFIAVALAAAVVLPKAAEASTILVTSRVGLGGTDFIDWAAGLNPVTTNGGLPVSVSQSTGSPLALVQGGGWNGNFAPGDTVYNTNTAGSSTSVTIDFASPVMGGGAQMQAVFFGAFVARITALDAGGNSLGSYTVNGNSNNSGNNSAIFIGILSNAADVDKLVFTLDSAFSAAGYFGINRVDIVPSAVPEPDTLALLGTGIAAIVAVRRRKTVRQ